MAKTRQPDDPEDPIDEASSTPREIPFEEVVRALLDVDTPLSPLYLYRLTDLDPAELKQLEQTWPQVPEWRRQALMEDIEELGSNDYILSFESISRFAIQDPDPKVRSLAVRCLWEFESEELIPVFLERLEKDSSPEVRSAAASALGRFIYAGEIEELPEAVLHLLEERLLNVARGTEPVEVRRHALESLGYSSRSEVPPLIESAFYSGQNDWIASALFAMGRSANNEAWEGLVLSMLENEEPDLRMEAARAAGELEASQAVPRLVELLNDDDPDVRTSAIWSLSQIGGEGVRDVLENMYEETEDDEEAEFIEAALDNLAFTEDLDLFAIMDVDEDDEEGEETWASGLEDDIADLTEDEEDPDD
jgi:HEAT repeat protein